MKYSSQTSFIVVWCGSDSIRLCRFRRKKKLYSVSACETLKCADGESPFELLKKGLKSVSWHSGMCLVLSGALPNSTFFQTGGVLMSAKDQRNALDFELSNHLINVPADKQLQFVQQPLDENSAALNVCVFPGSSLDGLIRGLTQQKMKIDEFVYPLLTLRKDDPPIYLPELDPDFYFENGSWIPVTPAVVSDTAAWENNCKQYFDFSEVTDFSLKEYLPCMLVARFIATGEMDRSRKELHLIPGSLRISRYRQHLCLSIILLLVLFTLLIWNFASSAIEQHSAYASVNTELKSYRNKAKKSVRQEKAQERTQKEFQKVLNIPRGESEMLDLLVQVSQILPQDVRVTRFRLTANGVQLEIQTLAENMNFTEILHDLKYWKVANVTQRRSNNISIVNLTLVRSGEKK